MINQFQGGMNKDSHPSNLQPSEYIEAWNAVQNSKEYGNLYNLSNEKGFSIYSDFKEKKPNNIIIGMFPINGRIVVFSITLFDEIEYKTSSSEVGFIDEDSIYKTVINDTNPNIYSSGFKPTQQQIDSYSDFEFLNFNINNQIDCEGRINFNNQLIVYWLDGLNRPRFLEIDRDYELPENKFEGLSRQVLIVDAPNKANVEYERTLDGGGLLTPGVYQFVVRYFNDVNQYTTFGYICHPIPVVDESESTADRNDYDGVGFNYPLQINKSIELEIQNLDLNFKFFEVIVIYYSGSSNTFNANVYRSFPIRDTTQKIIYNGEIGESVLLEELLQVPTSYDTGKHIIQKDGRIFISNLKSNSFLDLQPIANKLILAYTIKDKEITTTGFNNSSNIDNDNDEFFYINSSKDADYKNPNSTFEEKGYLRGEVYDFAIVGINKDNSETFAYHIPAKLVPSVSQQLETYESANGSSLASLYQSGSGIQDEQGNSLDNRPIRYHRFPSLVLEPHVTNNISSNLQTINIMGFQIPNLQAVLDEFPEITKKLKGIVVVRRKRDTQNNRSIYSRGLVHRMLSQESLKFQNGNYGLVFYPENMYPNPDWNSGDFGNTDIDANGNQYTNDFMLRVDPFSNNLNISRQILQRNTGGQPLNSVLITCGEVFNRFGNVNYAAFYSPETVLGALQKPDASYQLVEDLALVSLCRNVNSVQGMSYTEEGSMITTGGQFRAGFAGYDMIMHDYFNPSNAGHILRNPYNILTSYEILNNTGIEFSPNGRNNIGGLLRTINDSTSVGGFPTPSTPIRINGSGSEEYLLLELNSPFRENSLSGIIDQLFWYPALEPQINGLNDFTYVDATTTTVNPTPQRFVLLGRTRDSYYNGSIQERSLYSLRRNNASYAQYGSIDGAEYITVGKLNVINDIVETEIDNGTVINKRLFNGDIFISKFFYTSTIQLELAGAWQQNNDNNQGFYDLKDAITGSKNGHTFRGGHYFWVESEINCDYRHRPVDYVDPNDPGSWVDGAPYYPKNRLTVDTQGPVMAVDSELLPSRGYNSNYSKENDLKVYISKPLGFTNVNDFPNRTIYSEQSILGEQTDNNKIFLQKNFQETPRNKGEITGQFIHQNTLYLHTERSLFRTFVNQANAVLSNAQDLILGNGGVFSLPPQEIYPILSGHAGLLHKWTGVQTPFGYIFMDYFNKKVFMFGETLEEISQSGMYNWFKNSTPIMENNIINPNGSGAVAFYDPDNRRYVLTMKKGEEYKTVSFSMYSKKWTSFHDYKPAVVITMDQDIYSSSDISKGVYKHNSGSYGQYYDDILHEFIVTFCVNENKLISKVYDSLIINCDSYKGDEDLYQDVKQLIEFFDTLQCWNDYQNTGEVELKVRDNRMINVENEFDYNVKKVNNQFQVKIPLSKTEDNFENIYEEANFMPVMEDAARMRSKYLITKLVYKNSKNLYFVLMEIISKLRNSSR